MDSFQLLYLNSDYVDINEFLTYICLPHAARWQVVFPIFSAKTISHANKCQFEHFISEQF